MLAALFALALVLDTDPSFDFRSPAALILGAYLAFSLAIVWLTWTDWWLEAQLAGPAHAVDITVFAGLMATTQGYNSPYFTFFVFLMLAAAVRWGWRATILTAILLMSLYMLVGMLVANLTGGVLDDFVDRTTHLLILSLILIWFGANQWRSGLITRTGSPTAEPVLDESPQETGLRAATNSLQAGRGVLVWREHGKKEADVFHATDGKLSVTRMSGKPLETVTTPFLYDVGHDRALRMEDNRDFRTFPASEFIPAEAAKALGLGEGLAVPIKTGSGEGELFLEDLPHLSSDYINLGESIALDIVSLIERHALILAIEDSAEARSRLTLARDLHDSVVQFLAGAAFRLEAIKRDLIAGRDLEADLNDLKQLMLQEQGELRSFIAALRSAPQIGLDALTQDLRSLSERLALQWDVLCEFSAETTEMMVPTRLQLDTQHLVREAVANAVRHAGAKSVKIKIRSEAEKLRLDFINDGARYPNSPLTGEMPRSLSERVKLAGGVLELSRGMGVTRISVSLPISGRAI